MSPLVHGLGNKSVSSGGETVDDVSDFLPDWVKPGNVVRLRNHVRRKDDLKICEEKCKIERVLSPHVVEVSHDNGTKGTVSSHDIAYVPDGDGDDLDVEKNELVTRSTRSGREF